MQTGFWQGETHLKAWFKSKPKTLVGLDIGSYSVKVAGLTHLPGHSYQLEVLAREPIPHDSIVDGVIISKLPVAEAIDRIFKTHNIRNHQIATSVSGHSVIVKKVALPAQNEEELDAAIQWEAEQYIPFEISDVNLDYQIVRVLPESNRIELLLVAAKRDKITDQTSVISMAGKTPVVVDIDAFALQNAYEVNYQPEPNTVAGLLHIGSAIMNVSIVKGSEFLFTRDISMGGNHYTDFLQKELGISFEEAESYKRGEALTEELKQKTGKILDSVSDILALEIQKTFDYFKTTVRSQDINEIYLSGGGSRTAGFREYLQQKFQMPVQIFNPFKRIRTNGQRFPSAYLEDQACDFAVAVGLALRCAGDR